MTALGRFGREWSPAKARLRAGVAPIAPAADAMWAAPPPWPPLSGRVHSPAPAKAVPAGCAVRMS